MASNLFGTFKCSICGQTITGWGYNPWPVTKGQFDLYCTKCNYDKVVPARVEEHKRLTRKIHGH